MGRIVKVKGGVVWGWSIIRKYDLFRVVDETDIFYRVVPDKNFTYDYNRYSKFTNNNKILQVPKCYCILENP